MGDTIASNARRFGRYELLEYLGSGAMSDVYLAVHVALRKRVAIKMLRSPLLNDRDAAERFAREGGWAARVSHPNVVDVTDLGTHDGVPFLVMELLEGETLDDKLRREGPLPLTTAIDLLLPILDGVAAIHAVGVIHRDIKPANVLLARSSDGLLSPKLVDFGIATSRERRHITGALGPIGTPHYMSPEQAQGRRDLDDKSDQYSLASMLFECLTGREPFGVGDVSTVLARVRRGRFPELRTFVPELPAALDEVLARATELDPSKRYESVRDFAHALLPFASRRVRRLWISRELRVGVSAQSGPRSEEWSGPNLPVNEPYETIRTPGPASPRRSLLTVMVGTAALAVGLLLGTGYEPALGPAHPRPAIARALFRPPRSHAQHTTPPAPELRLAVTPKDAEITLDGKVLGKGDVVVPRLTDEALHELHVRAAGFVAQVFVFRGSYPTQTIVLEPVPPTPTVALTR